MERRKFRKGGATSGVELRQLQPCRRGGWGSIRQLQTTARNDRPISTQLDRAPPLSFRSGQNRSCLDPYFWPCQPQSFPVPYTDPFSSPDAEPYREIQSTQPKLINA